jgi:hypothetical protein
MCHGFHALPELGDQIYAVGKQVLEDSLVKIINGAKDFKILKIDSKLIYYFLFWMPCLTSSCDAFV